MDVTLLIYSHTVCHKYWFADWRMSFHHKIFYCVSGYAYYFDGDKKIVLEHNTFYIFPLLSQCELFHDPENPLEIVWFHIETPAPLSSQICKIKTDDNDYFKQIATLLTTSIHMSRDIVEPLIQSFFNACINQNYLNICDDERIYRTLTFISDNINRKITNEELADLSSYNSHYFIELFKKYTGMSPHQYIKICRLNKAYQYLMSNHSISETAELCGYSSGNVLSREVKNHFKVCASKIKTQDVFQMNLSDDYGRKRLEMLSKNNTSIK